MANRSRGACAAALAAIALVSGTSALAVDPAPVRPKITGISHIAVYAADAAAADHFYGHDLGGRKAADPEDPAGTRYLFGPRQFVEILPLPAGSGDSRLAHVAFETADAEALRRYLNARGAKASPLVRGADGSRWFSIDDPEGNAVRFVQSPAGSPAPASAIGSRVIHVGFMVRNRATEDRFWRDLLGFRPYWHGAMHEGATDWVSQQVPDGHDWLEYMLVGEGSTVAVDKVDAHQLGVLNHFSIGVPNMEAAVTRLIAEDRLSPRHDGPSMGRDGKWQANLYDPDGTRAELMEFKAVTKPCCSGFTAPDPVP